MGVIKRLYGEIDRLRPAHLSPPPPPSPHVLHGGGGGGGRLSSRRRATTDSYETVSTYHPDNQNERKFAKYVKQEVLKTLVALLYASFSLIICALIMTFVNDKVPDMETYPPLPDMFLDNVPYIDWAMVASEYISMVLMCVFLTICFVHKHRLVILRRFGSLIGTLYLLRAVCMFITVLPVPCKYFKCVKQVHTTAIERIWRVAYIAVSGGMTINGNRICGDYMFSGHTVIITVLNLFIDEYSSNNFQVLKTLGWVANMFGIFFVMAGHEHYSIDVFIAFYLSTRLFLYYHTLADNHHRLRYDGRKVRYWFPLFSYFESNMAGAIPYEYELPFKLPEAVLRKFKDL